MKRRLIRTLGLMSVLSVVLPFRVTPTEGHTSNPFLMHILNEQGQGIPDIRVVSDNGIVCRTRADGSVRWTERSVVNRSVRFVSTGRMATAMSRFSPRPAVGPMSCYRSDAHSFFERDT